MKILFSLMILTAGSVHATSVEVPDGAEIDTNQADSPFYTRVHAFLCGSLLEPNVDKQALFLAKQIYGFAEKAWRASVARDFSLEHDLLILTEEGFEIENDTGTMLKPERDYTPREREAFEKLLEDPMALPRAWRLRAARAFYVAVGGGTGSAYLTPHVDAGVHEFLRKLLRRAQDKAVDGFIPDATEAELKAIKR